MPRQNNRDVVLLQIALRLLRGHTFTRKELRAEFDLEYRTIDRYIAALRDDAGLPITSQKLGDRTVQYALSARRARLDIDAIDVSASSAKTLSLLLVAAALLPQNLGVRAAVNHTVRQALRLRGMKLATEMRRFEEAVVVLENEAKDYTGREEIFEALFDATLNGWCVDVDYRSPRRPPETIRLFPATLGLYRGGLYVLGVDVGDDGRAARWYALERIDDVPVVASDALLPTAVRLRALEGAARRWGPVGPAIAPSTTSATTAATTTTTATATGAGDAETLVTLHFSQRAAPLVRARPWHTAVDAEAWEDGGLRVSVRLTGQTFLFESWLLSWGAEVQVLRPAEMAERLAAEMERGARAHRAAAAEFARALADDDT